MATRLQPPRLPLPNLRAGDTLRVGAGTAIGRIYFASGPHPSTWDQFRAYGPVSRMRFDHQPPPSRVHPTRLISYQSPSRGRRRRRNDPLATCVRETFASTNLIDLSTDEPWLVLWAPSRPLLLLDLVDGPWLPRAGGNGAIASGARRMSRRWSRAIYAAYPTIDGVFYQASTLPSNRSIALYERARTALPTSYTLNLPLNHPGLRMAMKRIAHDYSMDLVT